MWEPSLLAMTAAHSTSMQPDYRYREQARSHSFSGLFTGIASIINPCGSELARDSALTAAT